MNTRTETNLIAQGTRPAVFIKESMNSIGGDKVARFKEFSRRSMENLAQEKLPKLGIKKDEDKATAIYLLITQGLNTMAKVPGPLGSVATTAKSLINKFGFAEPKEIIRKDNQEQAALQVQRAEAKEQARVVSSEQKLEDAIRSGPGAIKETSEELKAEFGEDGYKAKATEVFNSLMEEATSGHYKAEDIMPDIKPYVDAEGKENNGGYEPEAFYDTIKYLIEEVGVDVSEEWDMDTGYPGDETYWNMVQVALDDVLLAGDLIEVLSEGIYDTKARNEQ